RFRTVRSCQHRWDNHSPRLCRVSSSGSIGIHCRATGANQYEAVETRRRAELPITGLIKAYGLGVVTLVMVLALLWLGWEHRRDETRLTTWVEERRVLGGGWRAHGFPHPPPRFAPAGEGFAEKIPR